MKNTGLRLRGLLILIGVIALLIVILPFMLARVRYQRFRTTCTNNLSQISKAIHFYTNDYDNELPPNAEERNLMMLIMFLMRLGIELGTGRCHLG